MLVSSVPAPAGVQPVELGLLVCCVVFSDFAGQFDDSRGGTLGGMSSSCGLKGGVPLCCATLIDDDDGLLATNAIPLLFLSPYG
jgi:hypothetical protein